MMPRSRTTESQDAAIERARDILQADQRVVACWLEGSFAAGTADAWSDVDLHIAIDDSDWDAVFGQRRELLAHIRPILGHGEAAMPWGAHLVFATLSGPVRVDLYLEKVSQLRGAVRKEKPRILFDKAGVEETLSVNWHPDALIRMRLGELVRNYYFGCMWPVRLWGREEWGTLLLNSVSVIYGFLVPAILVQDDPNNFFRPQFHNERYLRPERRRTVDGLVAGISDAFGGATSGQPDYDALARLHEGLVGAIWRELRAACAKFAVEYPEAAEMEMRDYYRRELGIEVSA